MIPSVKALERAFPTKGKVLRQLLTSWGAVRQHPTSHGKFRLLSCYDRMEAVNVELGGSGEEYIQQGHNRRSPSFSYINLDETYATTILRIGKDQYRIGSWGDIVERGSYD